MAVSAEVQTAHQHRIAGQYDEALVLYREALANDAASSEAWWGLALVLMNVGEFDESLDAFAKAVELDQLNLRYLLDLGKLQTMLGMFDEAKPVFERIVELNPAAKEADDARNQLRYY